MSAEPRGLPLRIREMRPDDLGDIEAIERRSYDFPWSSGIFRDCLLAGYITVVAEQAGRVRGYAILSAAAGEAHLLNICLAPEVRGSGHGRTLLNHMIALARTRGAGTLYLEVRPSNHVAMSLYRSLGFEPMGVRRGYYRARGGSEDAVVLGLMLDCAESRESRS